MMEDTLPKLEKFEVDEIVELYKTIYQPAVKLVSARIRKHPNKTNNIIVSQWSQRNLERGSTVKILRSMLSDSCLKSSIEIDTVDISHWALSELSKSEKYKAVVHTTPNDGPKGGTKYYLEIWSEGKSAATFDLTALDLHGAVYTDDYFGALSWSSKEDKVIYLAEEKQPKTSPFYQQKSLSGSSEDSKDETGRGDQFVYEEDWGEVLTPKRQPVIAVCDINKKTINVLQGVPKDISPAQVICEINGGGVIGVGFKNTPRRIGVVYCTNRLNHIFHLSETGDYAILSDDNVSVLTPRFSPDGKYLIWLQRPCEGPHHGALSIIKYNWTTKEKTVVVDIIQDSVLTKNGKEFFGIFCQGFINKCWTSDSKFVILSTPQQYRVNTYAINIDDGNIWDIDSKNEEESTIILDISEDNYALFHTTSFKQPSVLASLHIPSAISGTSDEPLFVPLTKPYDVSDKNLISNFVIHNESSKNGNSFATYYGPQKATNECTPLILYPHGGPHASVPSAFIPAFDLFTKLGFGVLIVHFHGSAGLGQKYIDSLPGKVGSLDVEDCYAALQTSLKKFPWLDPNRVVLFGGSHGGFLVTHLSSQYPSAFIAVVALNPVVNLPPMIYTTDIPDWATVELGFPYEGLANVVNNQEIYNKMIEISPITNIRNVKAPTLLLLGKKDLRVPASQGLAYYFTLKELNVPTKLLFYEDNHSLGTVPVEMDSIINSVIWFQRCLKQIVK